MEKGQNKNVKMQIRKTKEGECRSGKHTLVHTIWGIDMKVNK
jgi:hypothetical protein